MDERTEMLEKITETLTEIQIDIAEIKKDVAYHIKRTDLNEENIERIVESLKPIQAHVALMQLVMKSFLAVAAVLGSVLSFIKGIGK